MWSAKNYSWVPLAQGAPGARELTHRAVPLVHPAPARLAAGVAPFITASFRKARGPQLLLGFPPHEDDMFHMCFAMRGPPNDIFFDLIPAASAWHEPISLANLTHLFRSLRVHFQATHVRVHGADFVLRNRVFALVLPAAERAGFTQRFINGKEYVAQEERVEDIVFYIDEAHLPAGLRPVRDDEKTYYFYKRKLDFVRRLLNQTEGATRVTQDVPMAEREKLWKFYWLTYAQEMPRMFAANVPESLRAWLRLLPQNYRRAREQDAATVTEWDQTVVLNTQEWAAYFASFPTKFPFLFAWSHVCRMRHWATLFL